MAYSSFFRYLPERRFRPVELAIRKMSMSFIVSVNNHIFTILKAYNADLIQSYATMFCMKHIHFLSLTFIMSITKINTKLRHPFIYKKRCLKPRAAKNWWSTLHKYFNEITNNFIYGMSNGLIDGSNNKIVLSNGSSACYRAFRT